MTLTVIRPLTDDDKRRLRELYEGRLEKYGRDVRTVGWGSEHDQRLRFSVLSRGLEFDGRRILDVGCGFGDFVKYLDDRGCRNYEYLGIDISPKLICEAQKCFGAHHRRFVSADLLEDPDIGEFDVVVSSGALSFRVTDNLAMAKQMIARMFSLSGEAVAVNFLSTHVDYQLPKNYHYDPEMMLSHACTLTPWVRLYHDYPLYEFTLQLFRKSNT